ncbi:hypothetical protein AVEN_253971-1 [Araneus ventricosus]|uniref:Uncharacterized protein n=1 Tax=Araneus ventricosus TaxID=182803 RepID=A0A4Y2MK68_ARAVE|nr:hypothetical protein AVEN_253971-1 [Araneus ventricosus]
MTRTTPELAPPSPNFHATPTGGRLTTTYDLTCNRPHTRRIFSGIGFRAWNPPAPKPLGHRGPQACREYGIPKRSGVFLNITSDQISVLI